MIIIGIDFSINSTAITINEDGQLKTFSFVPNFESGKRAFKTHDEISDIVEIHSYTKDGNTKDSIEDQRIKIRNASFLADTVISVIGEILTHCDRVNIEGFSYGSKGNSFVDLIMYNSFLRSKIYDIVGDKIFVIPPQTLKKWYTGNGNATKCGMLRTYIEKSDSTLSDRIRSMSLIKESEFTIPKPLDDIIDSIALAELGELGSN